MDQLNFQDILQRVIKYLIEGFAVAVAAYYIPRRNLNPQEIAMIAVTAAAIFAVLDLYSPSIASSTAC